jgi:hypothetical protein
MIENQPTLRIIDIKAFHGQVFVFWIWEEKVRRLCELLKSFVFHVVLPPFCE